MKRHFLVVGVFTAAALLAGCSSVRKMEPAALLPFTPSINATVAWTAQIGETAKLELGQGQFSPAVSGDGVYAASAAGVVTRVLLASGKESWKADVGAPIVAGVAVGSGVSQGYSAVITNKNELVVLTPEGKVQRRIALGGAALELPALLGNTAVVRLTDNRITAWDIQSGNRRWVVQRTLPPLVLHAQSGMRTAPQAPEEATSATLGPADAVVGLPGGRLVWIDTATGAVRWEAQVVTPRGANEVERLVDVLGAPSVHGPDVCVAAYQSVVSCFGAESGRRLWSKELSVVMPVAADQRFVAAVDSQSRLYAINRSDGEVIWQSDSFRFRNLSAPVSWGRAIWVADSLGFVHAVARENGTILARIKLDKASALSGAMRLTTAGLLLQTQSGQLMLIRSEG